jgi:hypothetical protein
MTTSLFSKETLSAVSSWAEVIAVVFTSIGALAGVTYVLASRPLRRAEVKEKLVLQGSIASAQAEAARAQERAGEANVEAANLEKEAAELRELAEKERLARVKLESEIAPRRLSGSQKEILVKLLGGYTGAYVAIVSPLLDPEGTDFADDLDAAIREAHWETLRIRNHLTGEYGVFVGTIDAKKSPGTKPLTDALHAIGVSTKLLVVRQNELSSTSPAFQSGVLYLVVGHKQPREAMQK